MRTLISISSLLAFIAATSFAQKELNPAFYADLGPEEIDVSKYPGEQKRRYEVFKRACSQCHTLARAVNSPVATKRAWRIYVAEMRFRDKFNKHAKLSKEDADAVIEFLAYDGLRRKIEKREEFDELTRKLQRRHWRTIKERMKRLQEGPPVLSPESP